MYKPLQRRRCLCPAIVSCHLSTQCHLSAQCHLAKVVPKTEPDGAEESAFGQKRASADGMFDGVFDGTVDGRFHGRFDGWHVGTSHADMID